MAPECRAKTVLVVEDDEATRSLLTELLALGGYQVMTAGHGGEALERLGAGVRPCLILLDMMMPVMDGETLLGILSDDPRYRDIPVIVSSAGRVDRSLAVASFLPKPIDLAQLEQQLERYC